jgi:alginate O-acetyltransferase complex protein AlgI
MHAGYLFAWPGMDATAFLNRGRSRSRKPSKAEWMLATSKTALGIALLFGGIRWAPSRYPYVVGWAGMVGIILVLHFGSFHLLSIAWRRVGVEAKPLMDWPLASIRVSEFWGRRWNSAFRDLTHRFLFRPLTSCFGARWALVVGFFCSGLVHELVISVPAGGGYGGPSLFFALQGLALLGERGALARKLGLGRGPAGRLLTMLVLLGPVYFLFHPPFVLGIVVPFLRALRAI